MSTGSRAPIAIALDTLARIATVDERFQSYNIEMAEVIGGRLWRPYAARESSGSSTAGSVASGPSQPLQVGEDPAIFEARPPVDLTRARMRRLASALGPAYVRVSGTWANTVYFAEEDTDTRTDPPSGFQGVLTHAQWAGVVDFVHATNGRLVTSFAIGTGVRDAAGAWTDDQARRLVDYTRSMGGEIAAAEMFNEPSAAVMGGAPAGYDSAAFARDFAVFRSFVKQAAPAMMIVGPGSVAEGILDMSELHHLRTQDMLSADPKPAFDIFSYHYYGAVSQRCAAVAPGAVTTAEAALSEEWLSRTELGYEFYAKLRDRFAPERPIWLTETADAACGGNPWAPTFLDTFRYLEQLGRLAKRGVQVIFHNTLASSEYGLLDQNTLTPRPNYWAALLWRRLMGTNVLDVGRSRSHVHLFAHDLRDHPTGVALLAINTQRTETSVLSLNVPTEGFTLTARELDDTEVQLNGHTLQLTPNAEVPRLSAQHIPPGPVKLEPASITFLAARDVRQVGSA